MLSSADIGFYNPLDFADPLAALIEGAAGRPIYVTGDLRLAPQLSDVAIIRFARRRPGATFINARGRYTGADDWFRRWRQERQRYGGAIVMTAGEAADGERSPCDDPGLLASQGLHTVGLSVFGEIEDLARLGCPILWHPVSPWRSALITRFGVGEFLWISSAQAAYLVPAPDAPPFRPFISGLFFASGAGDPASGAGQ